MRRSASIPSTSCFRQCRSSTGSRTLDLPRALTEMEAAQRLEELAGRNIVPPPQDIYLGAGSYQHYVPAAVGQILARGEFYTAYTPYQPEVAQGTLQVIYEFQSMVAELLGTEVANASMYDGATAMAEGALIAVSSTKKRTRIVVSGTVHPSYRRVLRTYVEGAGVAITEAGKTGSSPPSTTSRRILVTTSPAW